MTTDPFAEAMFAASRENNPHRDPQFGEFRAGAEWARTHLAAQELTVNIQCEEGKPATCEVRQGGVLVFSGRDHSADLRDAAQEPTDAESIARKNFGDAAVDRLAAHFGVTQEPGEEALDAALAARRDEEKR